MVKRGANRRSFLRNLALLTGAGFTSPSVLSAQISRISEALKAFQGGPDPFSNDEEFWHYIKQAYSVSPAILNLNNGGVSPQPRVVQEAVEHYNRLSNETPTYYMWRILDQGREPIRSKLADLAGCSAEEIAINRNASEALETIIFGLRLQRGDEVVLTRQDYPNMIHAWKQRAHRDGIVLKWLNFDFPIDNADAIVDTFVSAFSERTRVVHITHVINWNGQVMPAKRIAEQARKRGIESIVDGAHSFAQLRFSVRELDCDYFGTSLHKWLCAPFGSGLLYVKKDRIKNLYPLFGHSDPESDDIRKFESLGTRSFAIEQAIGHAVDFHQMIGTDRKEKRLKALKEYWVSEVSKLPGVQFGSPGKAENGCAIALLKVEDKTPREVARYLFSKHKIHTVAIDWENIHGVRVTPNVYTLKKDLDRLIVAVSELIKA